MIQEMTHNLDQRIQFDTRLQTPFSFIQTTIKVTFSCLGTLKLLDVANASPQMKEQAVSILKRAVKISLQLARHECMSFKKLNVFPQLRDTFQT